MYEFINSEIDTFKIQCLQAREVNRDECIKYNVDIKGLFNMTPQEELFSQLFNHEKILVKDMDILALRAHRENLAKIAFEARAKLTAVDDEERERKRTNQTGKGFSRNLNIDETSSNAINTIKKRTEKLSKFDKIREGLIKMGMDEAAADSVMSARNILDVTKKVQNQTAPEETEEKKIVFNPFEKK